MAVDVHYEASTIPAGLERYLVFRPSNKVRIHSFTMYNSSRPFADARYCYCFISKQTGTPTALPAKAGVIKQGHTSSENGVTHMPDNMVIEPGQQLNFYLTGANADVIAVWVLHEKVKEERKRLF